jgi:hypothetical protein
MTLIGNGGFVLPKTLQDSEATMVTDLQSPWFDV